MRDETIAIHAGYEPDPTTKAVAVPIYQTAAYVFDSADYGAALFNLEAAARRIEDAFLAAADDHDRHRIEPVIGDQPQEFDPVMLAERQVQRHGIETSALQKPGGLLEARYDDGLETEFRTDLADDGALQEIVVDDEQAPPRIRARRGLGH
jgi:hypothetical protein